MIELASNVLNFTFPDVHPEAELQINFQRTLRIPDDDHDYPLPPGLGTFPIQHVDDHAPNVPSSWLQHGGVMLPMFQSEAMWLDFDSSWIEQNDVAYPFAIKVAAGKQCAISGEPWNEGVTGKPQNYMVAPEQPWLDGFVVEKGCIRQFVAMPLGSGYSAEEQITGAAQHGGLQVAVYPMKRNVFERRFPKVKRMKKMQSHDVCYSMPECCSAPDMGLAPGGRMKQEIYSDPYDVDDWDIEAGGRCFVHLCNSMTWQSLTGEVPPHPAPTAKVYNSSGLPWFDYYDDSMTAVGGSPILAKLKSVAQLSAEKEDAALPENESVTPGNLVLCRKGLKQGQVREGAI